MPSVRAAWVYGREFRCFLGEIEEQRGVGRWTCTSGRMLLLKGSNVSSEYHSSLGAVILDDYVRPAMPIIVSFSTCTEVLGPSVEYEE